VRDVIGYGCACGVGCVWCGAVGGAQQRIFQPWGEYVGLVKGVHMCGLVHSRRASPTRVRRAWSAEDSAPDGDIVVDIGV
jgi:hypothetical protein